MTDIDWIIDFINKSPSSFHFIAKAKEELEKSGYAELKETKEWNEIPNKFFVERNGRNLIALNIIDKKGGVIAGAHCDFPTAIVHDFLNYGCPNRNTFNGRCFKIAGRVAFTRNGKTEVQLYDSKRPLLIRTNKEFTFNRMEVDKEEIRSIIAQDLGLDQNDILSLELIVVSDDEVQIIGTKKETLLAQKLDDNICASSALYAFLQAQPKQGFNAFVVFDNEEIGSQTPAGANNSFLADVMRRAGITNAALNNSLFLSCDTSFIYDPKFSSYYDKKDRPLPGKGPVYCESSKNSLACDKLATSQVLLIAENEKLPLQRYSLPTFSDPGATIARFILAETGIHAVEFCIPILGMHSLKETCNINDVKNFHNLVTKVMEHYLEVAY